MRWLGFDWDDREFYASDYFEQLYEYALCLIEKDKAFVCSLSTDDIRQYRGTLTEPGRESPYRNRSIEQNRELFEAMRSGKYVDGEHVLRAKIDIGNGFYLNTDPVFDSVRFSGKGKARPLNGGRNFCYGPSSSLICVLFLSRSLVHSPTRPECR